MDTDPEPEPLDLAHRLPRDAYHHLAYTLHRSLPRSASDTPDDLARRDHAAIARITSLLPANAAEASLAAQYVATDAHALDCMDLAQQPGLDPVMAAKCRAQSLGMARQSLSALRLLLRLQSLRRIMEADPAAADRAAWTEHCATGLMALGLPGSPAMPPPPEPAEPEPALEPELEPGPDASPEALLATAAEEYAVIYPRRAALIRRAGRLPDKVSFGPPDEDMVRALLDSRSPEMLALDHEYADTVLA
jgi:hypothetical protein